MTQHCRPCSVRLCTGCLVYPLFISLPDRTLNLPNCPLLLSHPYFSQADSCPCANHTAILLPWPVTHSAPAHLRFSGLYNVRGSLMEGFLEKVWFNLTKKTCFSNGDAKAILILNLLIHSCVFWLDMTNSLLFRFNVLRQCLIQTSMKKSLLWSLQESSEKLLSCTRK